MGVVELVGYNPEERAEQIVGLRHKRPGNYFMAQLRHKGLLVAPGVYCAMGGQIARQVREQELAAGLSCTYDFVYGSGWGISDMLLARPDMGFLTLQVFELIGKYIVAAAHPLPLILDAEAGMGTEVQLIDPVETYDRIGVAVAHLEDQAGTRRCGNLPMKRITELDVMEAKIYSWIKTTKDIGSSMRLMVRTDALTAMDGGIDLAIDRMRRYLDVHYQDFYPAISWADAMMKPEHIEKWCRSLEDSHPNVARALNYSPNKPWTEHYREVLGRENPPTYEELYDNGRGFHVQFHTILQARADMEATWNSFRNMARNGAQELWDLHDRQKKEKELWDQHGGRQGSPVGDPQAMSGFPPWQRYELEVGGEEARQRLERSQGYGKISDPEPETDNANDKEEQ